MSNETNIPRWTRFGLSGGAVLEPEGQDSSRMNPAARAAAGLPRKHELKDRVSLESFGLGPRIRPVRRGTFKPHPFLDALEISDAGGVRYHGKAWSPLVGSNQLLGEHLMQLHRPGPPTLRPDLDPSKNLQLLSCQKDLVMPTVPLEVLMTETHATQPERPTTGGEQLPQGPELSTWFREAMTAPLETPEHWPLAHRTAFWAISLRAYAWNRWVDRLEADDTSSTTLRT